jgi:hypothetical protein
MKERTATLLDAHERCTGLEVQARLEMDLYPCRGIME